jgi:hypothetical protein
MTPVNNHDLIAERILLKADVSEGGPHGATARSLLPWTPAPP